MTIHNLNQVKIVPKSIYSAALMAWSFSEINTKICLLFIKIYMFLILKL